VKGCTLRAWPNGAQAAVRLAGKKGGPKAREKNPFADRARVLERENARLGVHAERAVV